MTSISITKLYDFLTAKLGRETAENLTIFIQEKINTELDNKTTIFATKEDITRLEINTKEDIARLEVNTKENIARLEVNTKENITRLEVKLTEVKAELQTEIRETKSELIKWAFIFWVSQLAAMFAFLLFFIRK